MRKAYWLALFFTCAACGEAADDKASSNLPASNGSTAAESGDDADASEAVGATMTPAGPSLAAGGAAGAGGIVGGGGGSVGGSSAATIASAGASSAPLPGGAVSDASSRGAGTTASGAVAAPPAIVSPTEPPSVPVQPVVQSGQLTAGAWDDNLNYARFQQFRDKVAQTRSTGILPLTTAEFDAAHQRFSAPRSAHQQLDVALVIDTTGSMGDEISYLQREFNDLSSAIAETYPDAQQRWALIVYKDSGDVYVTRQFDFRTDLAALRSDLSAQSAGGGGDFPEAPDAAFEQLNQLTWRSGEAVARLAFWVADAPHHDQNATKMAATLRTAQSQDIHVYPVASSGIDDFTELSMRSAAQLTGGRYLFLTNDSGIGGAHKEPSIPCYFVTRLDHAILRMIAIEMSGKYQEPAPAQIIRTGGDPKDGACMLASEELTVF